MSGWINAGDRLPPFHTEVWVYRAPRGGRRQVEIYYVGSFPGECVYEDGITHWQPLVKPERPTS